MTRIIQITVAAVALAAGVYFFLQNDSAKNPNFGGEFSLTSHHGTPLSTRTFKGQYRLVYFGYTACPDACPIALNQMSQIIRALGDDARHVQAMFVTVDPTRDTTDLLKTYLSAFDPSIIGLTGSQSEVDKVIEQFHIYVKKVDLQREDGFYLVDHTTSIFLFDENGLYLTRYQHDETTQTMLDDLTQRIKANF